MTAPLVLDAAAVAAVVGRLLESPDPLRVVVLGSGPQAHGHVATLADTLAGRRSWPR